MVFLGEKGVAVKKGGILPENAATLGCAACRVLGKKIVISSSAGPLSSIIKNALVSGILSAGASVLDFGEQPIAITRKGIKFYNLDGGFHISDGGSKITILGNEGLKPDEKITDKIAEVYSSGDMPRAAGETIKEVISLHSYKLYYMRDIINGCSDKISFNLLLCITNNTTKDIVTAVLKDIGCKYTLYKGKPDETFSQVIKKEGYDLGVFIDESGERLTLYDETGEKIKGEIYECICAVMVFSQETDKTYYCGFTLPSALERIAENMGGCVIRSNSSEELIMRRMSYKGDVGSRFIFKFDAIGSIVKILDFLNENKLSLRALADSVPEFYMQEKEYILNQKLLEEVTDKLGIGEKGVRINERNGWAFIEKNKNLVRVVCEGASLEASEELISKYDEIFEK